MLVEHIAVGRHAPITAHPRQNVSIQSTRPKSRNATLDRSDQLLTVDEVALLGIQDTLECPSLYRQHVDCGRPGFDPGRVTDDIDESIKRMYPAKQIIVLAIPP